MCIWTIHKFVEAFLLRHFYIASDQGSKPVPRGIPWPFMWFLQRSWSHDVLCHIIIRFKDIPIVYAHNVEEGTRCENPRRKCGREAPILQGLEKSRPPSVLHYTKSSLDYRTPLWLMVIKSLPLSSIHWFLVWCDKADWSLQTRISTIAKQKVSLGRVSFRQVKGAIF